MNLLSVAAKNASRNRLRTALTTIAVSTAIVAFVLLRTVVDAWHVGVEHGARDRLATRNKVSLILPLPKRYVDTVKQTEGVKAVTWANWFGGKHPAHPNEFFATLAVDAPSFLEVYDEASLPADQRQKWLETKQGAILGDVLARKLGLQVGSRVTLESPIFPGEWQFEICGIYTATKKSLDRSQFFFHWEYFNEGVPPQAKDQVGWVLARIDSPERSANISAAVDRVFEEKDVQTATMSERNMNNAFMAMLSALLRAIDVVTAIILGIMGMLLGNTIAMSVRERTSEYGVLRAIGFSPRHVALFVLGEALTIGVLSGLAGLAVAYPLVSGLGRFLEEQVGAIFPYFEVAPSTAVIAVLATVGLAVASALVPAYRVSKLSVVDSLRRVA